MQAAITNTNHTFDVERSFITFPSSLEDKLKDNRQPSDPTARRE
jgi:hypothetical protein